MGIPVIKLNLVPAPSFWRRQHIMVGWVAIGIGAFALGLAGTVTVKAYWDAQQKEKEATQLNTEMQRFSADFLSIQNRLKTIDVTKELPKWRLAERILRERTTPWSRMNAELERCLVQDVRVKSVIRSRGSDQSMSIKLRGESRSAQAEADFIEALQGNAYFESVILDRETERQGGGMEFELILGISTAPPPYEPLPKYGPGPKSKAKEEVKPPVAAPSPTKGAAKPQGGVKGLKPPAEATAPAPAQTETRRVNLRQLRERTERTNSESPRKLPLREAE